MKSFLLFKVFRQRLIPSGLMWRCLQQYIFGTKEAFEGYDVDFSKIGGMCNNKEDFIKKINNHFKMTNNNYNEYSRNIFLEKYDTNKWITIMEKFLNKK